MSAVSTKKQLLSFGNQGLKKNNSKSVPGACVITRFFTKARFKGLIKGNADFIVVQSGHRLKSRICTDDDPDFAIVIGRDRE